MIKRSEFDYKSFVNMFGEKAYNEFVLNCTWAFFNLLNYFVCYIHIVLVLQKRSWQGFRGNDKEKDLIFTVDKVVDEFSRTEFKILLVGQNNEDSKTELLMKGSPFKRACTIYKGDTIVAQVLLKLS